MSYIKTVERECPHCYRREFRAYSKGVDFEYHTCQNDFFGVICAYCGLVFLNPIPLPEMLSAVYPMDYKPFHFNADHDGLIYKVRDFLEGQKAGFYCKLLPAKARVIDVGCADGRYMGILKKTNPAWEVEGIDFGEAAIKRARQKGLHVIHGAYEATALGECKYDLMIFNQVIEHFPSPDDIIKKAWRELKSGGLLSLETPSLDGWDAKAFKERFWGGYHFPRHLVLFNEKTIRVFLESRGFRVIRVKYLLSPVFWVFSVHHAWEEKGIVGASFWSDSNPFALGIAVIIDGIQLCVTGKTSNMQVIAVKE